jgi:3'-phosphoadenosine 5'-phosphosulfate sulfotransferase (PAPS reductase)/FAD synthetase
MQTIFSYGGGRQTVAMCLLIVKGVLPRPDRIVIADTSREKPTTWVYMRRYTVPLMNDYGMEIEVAPHSLATVDTHSHQGKFLLPVYTETGKLSAYCSGEWKRDVVERYLKQSGTKRGVTWLGLAHDEKRRWRGKIGSERHGFVIQCPLVEKMLTTADCLEIIRRQGWPVPEVSACWMCPNQRNSEWARTKRERPDLFELACQMDDDEREADERGGVWLHHSRVPLREADLTVSETKQVERQCSLGMCFV